MITEDRRTEVNINGFQFQGSMFAKMPPVLLPIEQGVFFYSKR